MFRQTARQTERQTDAYIDIDIDTDTFGQREKDIKGHRHT